MKQVFRVLHFAFYAMIAASFMVSCGDEEGAKPPIFQGFKYEPSTIHAGDSVTITAVILQKGRYLYAGKHYWSINLKLEDNDFPSGRDTTITYSTPDGLFEPSGENPTWKAGIPAKTIPGSYTCRFKATWNNAADGEMMSFTGNTGEGCTGFIQSICSTLFSEADGSFGFKVQ